jgi:nucleoside-diphosphate-sugar epimerase
MNKGFYKGKKVLVTGGTGFIGANVAAALVPLGAQNNASRSLKSQPFTYRGYPFESGNCHRRHPRSGAHAEDS